MCGYWVCILKAITSIFWSVIPLMKILNSKMYFVLVLYKNVCTYFYVYMTFLCLLFFGVYYNFVAIDV